MIEWKDNKDDCTVGSCRNVDDNVLCPAINL